MADRCLCTEPDAALCDGGGRPPSADGCGCACHGGADATTAYADRPQCACDEGRIAGLREAAEIARAAAREFLSVTDDDEEAPAARIRSVAAGSVAVRIGWRVAEVTRA